MRAATPRREMRAKAAADSLIGRLEVGARHARALRRPRQDGRRTSRRCGRSWPQAGVASRPHAKTHKCPAIAKLQLAAGSIGICTREGQRSRGALRQRRREDPDDDLERDGEQDPPRDEDPQGEPARSSRRSTTRRTRGPHRRREGSRHRRRRGRRRRGRHAQRAFRPTSGRWRWRSSSTSCRT